MTKKFTALLAILFSTACFSATLIPVQLINPIGSSAGQTIVSTGVSSAPGWSTVPLTGLSSQAANTVVANFTGSSGAPVAFAVPSCSATANALQYTSGTGFTCLTTLFSSPTITTPNITGVTNGGNSAGGSVGEFPAANTAGTSMSSATATNCSALSLTSGDWDVWGTVAFVPAAGTTISNILVGINTTSATLPASAQNEQQIQASFATSAGQTLATPIVRINISSSGTAYLIGYASFGTSTMTCSGWIQARRVR